MNDLITKYVDNFPVDIYFHNKRNKVIVPIYRRKNGMVFTEDYFCPKEFLNENLDKLIPRSSHGKDLTKLIKENLYSIIQEHIYKNGHIVDEVFEIYVGIFIMAFHACAQLNYPPLTKEKLEEWYSHIYRLYREAIPNQIFMRRKI